jgi:hypothetical protein
MKVELKNVKINKQLSDETVCFSADLWLDGMKAGTASNRGHGGNNEVHIQDRALFNAFNQFCLSQPAIPPSSSFNYELKMDMDLFISELVADHQERQAFKRRKNTTFFRLKNETYQKGEWRTVNAPYSPAVAQYLTTQYGDKLGEVAGQT